jgi:hypothetical protein
MEWRMREREREEERGRPRLQQGRRNRTKRGRYEDVTGSVWTSCIGMEHLVSRYIYEGE